jgi:hypothetical protein
MRDTTTPLGSSLNTPTEKLSDNGKDNVRFFRAPFSFAFRFAWDCLE